MPPRHPAALALALAPALALVSTLVAASALGLLHATTVRGQGGDVIDLEAAHWRALPSDMPVAGHNAAHDSESSELGRLLVIGGESAPLEATAGPRQLALGTGAWSEYVASGDAPVSALAGRGILGARAFVDQEDAALYLLCHCEGASLHRLDLDTDAWSIVSTDTTKSFVHGLFAYDEIDRRALLFGGDPRDVGLVSRTAWAFDLTPAGEGWSPLPDLPFGLVFQAAAIDTRHGHLLAFGGQDETFAVSDALWRLDMPAVNMPDAWAELTPDDGQLWPPARIGASMTFLGDSGYAILYGGYSAELVELGDVWLLDYSNPDAPLWSALDPDGDGPGPRAGHSAVWHGETRSLLLYGGARTVGSELRYLDLGTRLDFAPTPTPDPSIPTASPSPSPSASATDEPTPATPTPGGMHRILLPKVLDTHALE